MTVLLSLCVAVHHTDRLLEVFQGHVPGGETPGRFHNYHVLAHTIDQIRWFGSLLLMNSARWETTHSSLKSIYRTTRRATRTLHADLNRAKEKSDRAAFLLSECEPKNSKKAKTIDNSQQAESEEENEPPTRVWSKISKKHDVTVGDESGLAKFTFSRDIAKAFWSGYVAVLSLAL